MSSLRFTALALFCLCLLLDRPYAAGGPYLAVDGEVTTPLTLSEADFRNLPRMSVKVKDAGGHDVTYEGSISPSCCAVRACR
jgi:hypothetical protein